MATTPRRFATALALALLSASTALAQPDMSFKDSWFWGVKGGLISFSTATVDGRTEPLVGGEWLITRTQGALYLSLDQSLFDATSALTDTAGGSHSVTVRDMRRFTAAAMAFPRHFDVEIARISPYAGVGFALNFIRQARLVNAPPTDSALRRDVNERLEDQQDRAAPILILGVQFQVGRFAAFAQATGMPAETRFLLNGSPTAFVEVGLRFNAGRSRIPFDR